MNKPNTQPIEISTSIVTSQVISSSHTGQVKDQRLVAIKVKYPENYKGPKHLQDGKVYEMDTNTANEIIKKGIAKKVKAEGE